GFDTPTTFLHGTLDGVANRDWLLEELILLWVTNQNPAYAKIEPLVSDRDLAASTAYRAIMGEVAMFFSEGPTFGPKNQTLLELLLSPGRHAPGSLEDQLAYMREDWGLLLEEAGALGKLLFGVDVFAEEAKWFERRHQGLAGGPGDADTSPVAFHGDGYENEPERFSADNDWMPRVVMMAKSTFVWLEQLSRRYGRHIDSLAAIPDEELDALRARGFTALWLIGIWRRSEASRTIKQRHGATDAVASAYSLYSYEIAHDLGGEAAYESLRTRCERRGIRLASDMVPNHMGVDSAWVVNHPDWFIQSKEPPFPGYSFDGPDLSTDPRVGVFIEDGYWTRTDAAVVFKRLDRHTGDVRYVYHGNDGTSMPWNDTAQLDYMKAEVR
ncbi:alpha-amylase, partial [bacterium]